MRANKTLVYVCFCFFSAIAVLSSFRGPFSEREKTAKDLGRSW